MVPFGQTWCNISHNARLLHQALQQKIWPWFFVSIMTIFSRTPTAERLDTIGHGRWSKLRLPSMGYFVDAVVLICIVSSSDGSSYSSICNVPWIFGMFFKVVAIVRVSLVLFEYSRLGLFVLVVFYAPCTFLLSHVGLLKSLDVAGLVAQPCLSPLTPH